VGQKVGHRVKKANWPEAIAAILIPPACREEVLGDLYERNVTPRQYVRDAVRTVPLVIAGRIRRTSDTGLLAMHAIVLYLSFFGAALFEVPPLIYERWGLWRLAIPCAAGLLAILLENAYSDLSHASALRLLRGPMFALAGACVSQAALWVSGSSLTLPLSIVLLGGLLALLLTFAIRLLFQPPSKSQRGPI
jgi:hypothetical protein